MAESPSSSAVSPDAGSTLGGKYRVVRRIGEGGMGVVVEAENLISGKRVAIKWMHPQVAARPDATERFLREARASARVRHPNVVDVYDVVHEGGTCFLVMELLEGEPLAYLLERGGMPAHELIALLLDAMRGVAAAHKQGVIHRDIKPDNIFLAHEGDRPTRTPKVLDFGISKMTGSDALSLTRTGATLGTPMYMSFEQICAAKDIDARTDIYAFGVILYEALTGQPPFHAESFPELIVKITNTRPTPPKQLRPDIPSSLDRLVQRAMAKEREQRVGSLDQLIAELAPFSTASSFRAQMTADDAALPRVVAYSDQPAAEPQPLVVEGRDSAPNATPMGASVPIPAPPRRRDALPWLIVGGALLSVLGALTLYGNGADAPQPAAATEPPRAERSQPTAASLPPPAPASRPAESPGPGAAAAAAASTLAPARPAATTSAAKTASATSAAKSASAPAPARPAPASTAAKPAATDLSHKPVTGAAVQRPPTAAAAKPATAAESEAQRFRAGRPRSEDF